MRPIKFRGKRTDNDEWIEDPSILIDDEICDRVGIMDSTEGLFVDVYPYTLGQFTGCVDKNGKEIYEDDVVLLKDNKVAVVKYQPNLYGFYADFHTLDQWEMEVIGNIHDNPQYNK